MALRPASPISSDRNSACCKNCKFQTRGEVCQEPIDATCRGHSYCTGGAAHSAARAVAVLVVVCKATAVCVFPGNSSECPPPEKASDATVCLDSGQCLDGECVPFCRAMLQLQPCACNGLSLILTFFSW